MICGTNWSSLFLLRVKAGKHESKKNQQINQYKQFVSIEDTEEISLVFDKNYLPSMLGSEAFIKWVKKTFFIKKQDMEIPESKSLAPNNKRILKTVCSFYQINEEQLFSVKRGTENEPRNIAIYLMRSLRGETLIKIGFEFNLIRYSSVSSVIERTKKRLQKDRKFRKRIEKIKALIVKCQE